CAIVSLTNGSALAPLKVRSWLVATRSGWAGSRSAGGVGASYRAGGASSRPGGASYSAAAGSVSVGAASGSASDGSASAAGSSVDASWVAGASGGGPQSRAPATSSRELLIPAIASPVSEGISSTGRSSSTGSVG